MGTTWHNMWSLVLPYQPTVRGSCNGRTVGMFDEATMVEPIRHKRGLLGVCDAHIGGETSVGML
jgi:hypothetical protein